MKKRAIYIVLLALIIVSATIYLNRFALRSVLSTAIKKQIREDFLQESTLQKPKSISESQDKFTFSIITDIHSDTDNLNLAVSKINSSTSKFVIGLGDYTNVGTNEELAAVKRSLNKLSKPMHLLPGDHDLWNGRDKTINPHTFYNEIFSPIAKSFTYQDVKFLFLDNSDIYNGVSETELKEFESQLSLTTSPVIIISSHKAIFHPLTIHRMGYINDQKNNYVLFQAEYIMKLIRAKRTSQIILLSGDLHNFSKYSMPTDSFEAYSIGALTDTKNFQSPRYSIGHIKTDNSVQIKDIPIGD